MNSGQPVFTGRAGLQQRVFAGYRKLFFDTLAAACQGGLSVFAGSPGADEGILPGDLLDVARYVPARNRHFLHADSPFYVCWQSGWLDWLNKWRPEALIVEANSRTESTRLAIGWMHARKRQVLGWGLGLPEARTGFSGLIRRLDQFTFLRSLDGMIAYSERGAAEYCSLGFRSDRVFIAPNAVSPKPANPLPDRPLVFHAQPNVLFVGRLQERKRIDNLLRACAAQPPSLQPRLVIVGDGPALAELQNLAREVYPSAEFPGAKVGTELEAYFAAADLFILPGTGGLAIQQAMAHGLPVIVAEADGTQQNLVRPGNGMLIPPNNLSALIKAIQAALSDIGRLRQMGRESYRIVSEEANLEAMVVVFVEALTKAVTWK